MMSPDLESRRPGTPPPLPPEPPPLRTELFEVPRAPESLEDVFEVQEVSTEHFTVAAANVPKAAINPQEYSGPSQDTYAIFPKTGEVLIGDGLGGALAGELASRMHCEEWPRFVEKAKDELAATRTSERETLWQYVMTEGQPVVTPKLIEIAKASDRAQEEAEGQPEGSIRVQEQKYVAAREQELNAARERFRAMEDVPEAVRLEAIARFRALQEASQSIYNAAQEKPAEREGMSTTSSGAMVMDVDGEPWGIFWGVGDSVVQLESRDPKTGAPAMEEVVTVDDGITFYRSLGDFSEQKIQDFENPFLHQAAAVLGKDTETKLRSALTTLDAESQHTLLSMKTGLGLMENGPAALQAELRTKLELDSNDTTPEAIAVALAVKFAAIKNPIIRHARFQLCMQALGQAEEVMPHLMVRKLEPKQRFRVASDGGTDSRLDADPRTTVLNRSAGMSIARGTEQAMREAIDGFRKKMGKTPDDITIIDGEVRGTVELSEDVVQWSLFVERALDHERISGKEREVLLAILLNENIRQEVVAPMLEEAARRHLVADRDVTNVLQEHLARKIVDLRLERIRSKIDEADTSDLAAE